jgi:hypothetical protein
VDGLPAGTVDEAALNILLDKLLSTMAVPAMDNGYRAELGECGILEVLADHGVVMATRAGDGGLQWFLTIPGVHRLRYESGIAGGHAILQLRLEVLQVANVCVNRVGKMVDCVYKMV